MAHMDDSRRKSEKKTPTLATITAAIITMAVLFTGSLGAVVTTSVYAQEEEGEVVDNATAEAVDAVTLNDTGTGQLPEEAAMADPEVQIQEEPTQGNAILIEQVLSPLEECYAMLDSLGMILVKAESKPDRGRRNS